jgi:3-methyladenine DNA glycosylase AlkC
VAEPLKTFFSPALVRDIGASIARAHPAFPLRAFVRDAAAGLDSLELLDRGRHIAAALHRHLPPRYEDAIAVLLASLGPEHARDELTGAGMAPFFYMPHLVFVMSAGLDDFERSMHAQKELTKRFTAEFSIRPFLERYPDRTLAVLAEWASDPSPHVRRLVSEGTRPRLPWAPRVRFLDEHPERVLPLLEKLKDDPTTLVRRSVANHLNDLGKARSELLIETCRRWLEDASPERRRLVEHALRSAVKKGSAGALALVGHGDAPKVALEEVQFEPARVAIGGRVRISFTLRSRARKAQALLVDVAVHFVKANGRTSAKVFKVSRPSLPAGGSATLSKVISLAVHTTRQPYAGAHPVEVLVNGTPFPAGAFEVMGARRRPKQNT